MKNKVFMLLLSLLIAFGLWLYVITAVSPDSEISIDGVPVQIQGEKLLLEQSNLMIVGISDSDVSLVLNGNRSDLNKLNKNNITITMDVSRIDRAGRHAVTYDVVLPGDIPSNAVAVQTRDPDRLFIMVENRVRNPEVPLRVSYDKTLLPGGYKLRESGVEYPEYVTVSGPESIMDTIAYAKVDLDLTDRQESYENTPVAYKLYDSKGNVVESELLTCDGTVPLTMPINYTKELPLKLQFKDGGGATAADALVQFFVPKADDEDADGEDQEITSISVSGSKHILEGETALTLGVVDLSTVSDGYVKHFKLDEQPLLKEEGIHNETAINEIYAKITFPKLKEVPFENVTVHTENVGKGFNANNIAGRIDLVIIRGPINLIDQLQSDDFELIVDLTGVTESEEYHPIKIVFKKPGFEKLGVILSQKDVKVKVTRLPEDES